MRRPSGSAWVLIAIMVAMLAAMADLLTYQSFATKVMPLAVSGTIFVLAAIQLWREMRTKTGRKPAGRESGIESDTPARGRRLLAVAAWMVGFALAVYLVGFYIASFLLVLSYMKRHGSKWPAAILSAVLSTAAFYLVFDVALKATVHRGVVSIF